MFKKLAPLALMGALSLCASAQQTGSTPTQVVVNAGANSLTAPTGLDFTTTITGAPITNLPGSWSGNLQVAKLDGTSAAWTVNVGANQFTGVTPGPGLVGADTANLDIAAFSYTGADYAPADWTLSGVTGVPGIGAPATIIAADPAGPSGTSTRVGTQPFTPGAATLDLPFNVAAGTYSTSLVFTAAGLP